MIHYDIHIFKTESHSNIQTEMQDDRYGRGYYIKYFLPFARAVDHVM